MNADAGLTRLLARPWIDPLCLWGMGWILPAARSWAAASSGDVAAFQSALGLRPVSEGIAARVRETGRLGRGSRAAQERWVEAAFGDGRRVAEAEFHRREAAHSYLGQRLRYVWFARRNRIPAVSLDVPAPSELFSAIGTATPDSFFALAGQDVAVTVSHAIAHDGVREYWLRFPSPDDPADSCWVHVYEGRNHGNGRLPSLVFGHGFAMETEMMRGDMRGYRALAASGCRILLPDAPGHNRRASPGLYGGESFMRRPPMSGLLHFRKAARELAVIIGWCRDTGAGPVALGGTSLGALTAQVFAERTGAFPEAARPDALLLLTTTDRVSALTFNSSLSVIAGLGRATRQAGWTEAHVADLARFTDSTGPAPVDPGRIVLLIGRHDDVTPYDGGQRLAENWRIPPENLFVRDQGHFSAAIGLAADPAPFRRMVSLLREAGK